MYKWSDIARKKQLLPQGNWKIWLIVAGRGFGKTRAASENIIELILQQKYTRIALLGSSNEAVTQVMLEGNGGIIPVLKRHSLCYRYLRSERKIIISNSIIFGIGADNYNKLRGFEFDLVWIDELIKFRYQQQVYEQARLCLRLPKSRMIITTTPGDIPLLVCLKKNKDVHYTNGTSYENKKLSQAFKDYGKLIENTTLGQREILGKNTKNYFWSKVDIQYIDKYDIISYHLGVDVAVKNGTTGLILSCTIATGKLVVLEDLSKAADYWLPTLEEIVQKYPNITIDFERNQGGILIDKIFDLLKVSVIRRPIFVSSSKKRRHYLLYNLYKKGAILHSKPIPSLEHSLLYGTKVDNIDALIYTASHLQIMVPTKITYI